MLDYLLLLLIAIIVIPIFFMLSAKNKIARSVPFIIIIGVLVALTGIFIDQNFPYYYTIFIMIGLAFALSVLLDKRLAGKAVVKDLHHEKFLVGEPQGEMASQQFIEEESAATVEEEDIIIDKSTDDDLENWMSDTQKKKIRPEEGRDRSGE